MRRVGVLAAGLVGLWTVGAAAQARAGDGRPIVAVFDVDGGRSGLSVQFRANLAEYLSSKLTESGRYTVVPRDQIRQRLFAEKKASHKECYDQTCQIELGKELAAEKSLSTKVMKMGKRCTLTLTLYDLRKATTEAAATKHGPCDETGVVETVDAALAKLFGATPVQPMTAKKEPPKPEDKPKPVATPFPEQLDPPGGAVPASALKPPPPLQVSLLASDATRFDPQRFKKLMVKRKKLMRGTTSFPDGPDRSRIMFDLAEANREIAVLASLQSTPAQSLVQEARKQALESYTYILRNDPRFMRLDEVLFHQGALLADEGNAKASTQLYYQLIKQYPQSKFIPLAYLALGVRFLATNKIANANKAFARAVLFPESRAFLHSLYGLAWCEYSLGRKAEAKNFLDKLIKAIDRKTTKALPPDKQQALRADAARLRSSL